MTGARNHRVGAQPWERREWLPFYYTRRAPTHPSLRPYVGELSRERLDAAPEIDMNIDKQTPLALAREEGPFLLIL